MRPWHKILLRALISAETMTTRAEAVRATLYAYQSLQREYLNRVIDRHRRVADWCRKRLAQ
jgi:hypothetical protein